MATTAKGTVCFQDHLNYLNRILPVEGLDDFGARIRDKALDILNVSEEEGKKRYYNDNQTIDNNVQIINFYAHLLVDLGGPILSDSDSKEKSKLREVVKKVFDVIESLMNQNKEEDASIQTSAKRQLISTILTLSKFRDCFGNWYLKDKMVNLIFQNRDIYPLDALEKAPNTCLEAHQYSYMTLLFEAVCEQDYEKTRMLIANNAHLFDLLASNEQTAVDKVLESDSDDIKALFAFNLPEQKQPQALKDWVEGLTVKQQRSLSKKHKVRPQANIYEQQSQGLEPQHQQRIFRDDYSQCATQSDHYLRERYSSFHRDSFINVEKQQEIRDNAMPSRALIIKKLVYGFFVLASIAAAISVPMIFGVSLLTITLASVAVALGAFAVLSLRRLNAVVELI